MENTFQLDITFLSRELQQDNTFQEENVTKKFTFKELNQTDSSQHMLHFLIASILEFKKGEGGADDKVFIEHEKMYSLAVKAINALIVIGDGITEADKTQVLADSFALLNFGDWFATKKALPFFIKSRTNLVK